ncbi:MAG: tetratricopeptide repeat protein, partial [Deferrisomatales bacterium]|nr:tetratricopeptide repeat protein [Deferrisomatales bacterium]
RIPAERVTIAHSIDGNFLPLKFRYLGGWLQHLLETPEIFDGPPPEPWTMMADAELLEAALKLEEAEAIYRRLLEAAPDNPAAEFSLARNLFLQKRFDDAFRAASRAADLEPAYALGFLKLGHDFHREGWHEGARWMFEEGKRRMPGDARPLMQLGNLYFNAGRYREAEGHYRQVLSRQPENASARLYLADTLLEQGDAAAALAEYQALQASQPHFSQRNRPILTLNRARAYEALGRTGEAIKLYRDALGTGRLSTGSEGFAQEKIQNLLAAERPGK